MTPTPMARAVEAAQMIPPRAREGCKCTHGPDEEDAGLCPPCYMCPECDAAWYDAMLRAALPALLEAVIGALSQAETRALEAEILRINANVPYMTSEAQPNALIRRALLKALHDAAGRVG